MYQIARITDKDDGLIATAFIREGVAILAEDPLVSVQFSWNKAYSYKACDHCMRPLETAEECARRLTAKSSLVLPYPELCETDTSQICTCPSCDEQYCSAECRNKALDQYHRTLCKGSNNNHPLDVLNEVGMHFHYPPESCSVMLIPRIIATIQQAKDKEEALRTFLQFRHRTINEDASIFHKLLGNGFQSQIEEVRRYTMEAVPNDGVEQLLTYEGFRALLVLIGTNGQGVGTTPIGRWAKKAMAMPLNDDEHKAITDYVDTLYNDMEAHSGSFLSNEGVGLYSVQSKCNHSCNPNAISVFLDNNTHLSLVALRDIQVGEEICISYLNNCELEKSRHSRQKLLKENYLFLCSCEKCIQEASQPDVTSEEDPEDSDSEDDNHI